MADSVVGLMLLESFFGLLDETEPLLDGLPADLLFPELESLLALFLLGMSTSNRCVFDFSNSALSQAHNTRSD